MDQSSLAAVSGIQAQTTASKTLAETTAQTDGSFMDHILSRMASNTDDSNTEAAQKKAQSTQSTQPAQPKRNATTPDKNTKSSQTSSQAAKPATTTSSAKPAAATEKDKQAAAQNAKNASASASNTTSNPSTKTASSSDSADASDDTDSTSDTTAADDAQATAQAQTSATDNGTDPQATTVVVVTTVVTATTDTATLTAAGKKKLSQMIDSLLNMLPGSEKQTALTQLQNMLGQQTPSLSANGTDPGQALIAAGLSPQQLTDLIGQLQQMKGGGQGSLDIEALSLDAAQSPAGIGSDATPALPATAQLTPVPLKRDAIFSPRSATPAGASKNLGASIAADDTDDADVETTGQVNSMTSDLSGSGNTNGSNALKNAGFDSVMKVFEHMQDAAQIGGQTNVAANGLAQSANQAANAAAAATVQNAATSTPTNALTSTNGAAAQTFPGGSNWATSQNAVGAMTPMTGMSVTDAAAMTSLVTNSALATAAHPAMQVIATTIMASSEDGDDKDITVKLDPAELGKVQVQMKIGKDNTATAHILVEKPETYIMMQRDQHVLQRALANTGLDVNGNSLSFELAQNGMNFAKNNGTGNGGGTGSSASGDETGTVLETTMNWSVDPTSGQTHYNLLA